MVGARVWMWSALASRASQCRSLGSKMSRRSSRTARITGREVAGTESTSAAVCADSTAGRQGRAAAGPAGTATALQRNRGAKDNPPSGSPRDSAATLARIRSGVMPAAAQRVLAELAGADQPPLEPRPLGALDVGPEVVAHHRPPAWSTAEPEARQRGAYRRRGSACRRRLAVHAGGILQRGDERPRVQREAVALPPVAVAREGDDRRAAISVLERLLQQGVTSTVRRDRPGRRRRASRCGR